MPADNTLQNLLGWSEAQQNTGSSFSGFIYEFHAVHSWFSRCSSCSNSLAARLSWFHSSLPVWTSFFLKKILTSVLRSVWARLQVFVMSWAPWVLNLSGPQPITMQRVAGFFFLFGYLKFFIIIMILYPGFVDIQRVIQVIPHKSNRIWGKFPPQQSKSADFYSAITWVYLTKPLKMSTTYIFWYWWYSQFMFLHFWCSKATVSLH